jgi:hypothetical protein
VMVTPLGNSTGFLPILDIVGFLFLLLIDLCSATTEA